MKLTNVINKMINEKSLPIEDDLRKLIHSGFKKNKPVGKTAKATKYEFDFGAFTKNLVVLETDEGGEYLIAIQDRRVQKGSRFSTPHSIESNFEDVAQKVLKDAAKFLAKKFDGKWKVEGPHNDDWPTGGTRKFYNLNNY